MTIILYKNNNTKNRLNKSLVTLETREVVFKETTNVINPTLVLTGISSLLDANYIYIESLTRYYFIESYDILNENQISVSLSLDPLQTYKDYILSSRVISNRATSNANYYLPDTSRPMEIGNKTYTKVFKNGDGKIDSSNVSLRTGMTHVITTF